MNKTFYDNLVAFIFGDISAMIALAILKIDWLLAIEHVVTKLFIIVASGLIGGAAGVIGKHFMQKILDKHFNIIIGCCLMAVAMAGCKTQNAGVVTRSATETKDSTSVQVIERFVPVEVPGDTVWYENWIECPDVYPIYDNYPLNTPPASLKKRVNTPKPMKAQLQGKRSNAAIEIDDSGKLTAIFNCSAWRDSVKVRDTEIARLKSIHQTESEVRTVQVRYIPKAYKASMWFSWIVIALVVGRIALKVALNYFKIQLPFLSWIIK
jgi:hypothetical protein